MIAAADVRAALTAERVLDAYGVRYVRRGSELRTRQCPVCGRRARDSVSIDATGGAWIDHAHGCHGGVLDLLAGLAGLDIEREFARVVTRGAELAGIADGDGNREAIERMIAERKAAEARVERERAEHVVQMPSVWAKLATRSTVGECYLAGRGIDPAALRDLGRDVLRYSESGEVAVPMHSLADGAIVGIQYRAPRGKGFRTALGSVADGAALVGRAAELDGGGVDIAVICEGLADTLAACLAWPSCAVFGAPGAGHMATIAAAVAPRVRAAGGYLFIVVDDDETGIENAAEALDAAEIAGLADGRDVHIIETGDHHDLADAWRAGWRWRWPDETGAAR